MSTNLKPAINISSQTCKKTFKKIMFHLVNRRTFCVSFRTCRLPFFIMWLLILILLFYVSQNTLTVQQDRTKLSRTTRQDNHNQFNKHQQQEFDFNTIHQISQNSPQFHSDTKTPQQPSRVLPSTTVKSPTSDYVRQGKVFILLVQDEDIRSKSIDNLSKESHSIYPSKSTVVEDYKSKRFQHKPFIPQHIQLLIEVLDYHRIDYSIGSSRFGLPAQLLESVNQDIKRYSVVVIDDFIRYTGLNRWLRDQLDRFCRSNKIGVITYLLDNNKLDHHLTDELNHENNSDLNNELKSDVDLDQVTNSRSIYDRFPLTFHPIRQNCRNSASSQCLVNYQLNENVDILRILKRRKNFLIEGDLPGNFDNTLLMTMSSNHITYEPLTWARLRTKSRPLVVGKRSRHSEVPTKLRYNNKSSYTRNEHDNELNISLTKNVTRETVYEAKGKEKLHYKHKRAAVAGPVLNQITQNLLAEQEMMAGNFSSRLEVSKGRDNSLHAPGEKTQVDESEFSSSSSDQSTDSADGDHGERRVLSMIDRGLYDGIKRVIFGHLNRHWLDRVLLLDIIENFSSGDILTPLERYVQIDIDDIFVGERGTRLKREDVDALLKTQEDYANAFEGGFKFNLGFSGKFYKRGHPVEQEGDEYLISQADKFTWFCHFFSHAKAHLLNNSNPSLIDELQKNLRFAKEKNITLIGHSPGQNYELGHFPPTYAVAPHHSGVYPVHEDLYDSWQSVLNVRVTSTEEYPHLRPAGGRRGFVHKNIKVLPRQVCGLYTHTIYRDKYPGGIERLVSSIRGGELFETILHNPVNIYMTHMSNYANDRLAPYTFGELFKFVQDYTNIRLKYASSITQHQASTNSYDLNGLNISDDSEDRLGPLKLANYYFDVNPDQREPLWTNPCEDKRHMAIWSPKSAHLCNQIPTLLIVGPQKTGTTALHSFLKLNPLFRTSSLSSQDFEEVQFFNDKHYYKGVDWYLSRFSNNSSKVDQRNVIFYLDKSATYFDDPKVPQRAGSLLPDAKIIISLINPADRAYSWYQHIKAHGDRIANEFTFDEIIDVNNLDRNRHRLRRRRLNEDPILSSPRLINATKVDQIEALHKRCLGPGYYSSHLSNWLKHYDPRQIIIIDGEWFKYNPVAVLNRLQLLLGVANPIDYSNLLAYNKFKGFYCERVEQMMKVNENELPKRPRSRSNRQIRTKCLGSGKGRRYEPMSQSARLWLNRHYLAHNRQLAGLLYEIGQPLPVWLDQSLNELPVSSSE